MATVPALGGGEFWRHFMMLQVAIEHLLGGRDANARCAQLTERSRRHRAGVGRAASSQTPAQARRNGKREHAGERG